MHRLSPDAPACLQGHTLYSPQMAALPQHYPAGARHGGMASFPVSTGNMHQIHEGFLVLPHEFEHIVEGKDTHQLPCGIHHHQATDMIRGAFGDSDVP